MNVKNVILSLAIAIIFAFFVGYGIEVFDPVSDSSECYDNEYRLYDLRSEAECLEAEGIYATESESFVEEPGTPVVKPALDDAEPDLIKPADVGRCIPDYEKQQRCYTEYEAAKKNHDMVVFIVGIVIGVFAILYGTLLRTSTISSGILLGGLILVIYGTVRYWRYADNTLKFILLGIALAVLIWFAYKKIDRFKVK